MEQNRWKSKYVWLALAALASFVAKEWIGIEIPQFDTFVDLALTAAIAIGVVNNPTDSQNW